MADITENPFDNFGIVESGEAGNTQLINDLISPETSTSNPDEIENIVETVKADDVSKKETPEPTTEKPNTAISDFLGSDDDDEDGDEEDITEKTATAPKKEISEEIKDGAPETTQFSALADDLTKLGVFTQTEGEEESPINTPEELLERFNAEKQKGAIEVVNNFIGQFGEDYQKAFDAIFVKGASPKDYFSTMENVSSFSSLELDGEENERNQERVLKQALTDQGFEPEDVETEIERLKNYGDLESVSKKHHKVLIKKEAAKLDQLEQQAQTQLQQKQDYKNQYVQNVQTVLQEKIKEKNFDGIPINPKLAGELQDFLLTDKYKTATGETLTDFDKTILDLKRPENHGLKVKVGLLLKMLEKDPSLSSIQKTGVTKKTNQLFGSLAKQVTRDTTIKTKPTSWFK